MMVACWFNLLPHYITNLIYFFLFWALSLFNPPFVRRKKLCNIFLYPYSVYSIPIGFSCSFRMMCFKLKPTCIHYDLQWNLFCLNEKKKKFHKKITTKISFRCHESTEKQTNEIKQNKLWTKSNLEQKSCCVR